MRKILITLFFLMMLITSVNATWEPVPIAINKTSSSEYGGHVWGYAHDDDPITYASPNNGCGETTAWNLWYSGSHEWEYCQLMVNHADTWSIVFNPDDGVNHVHNDGVALTNQNTTYTRLNVTYSGSRNASRISAFFTGSSWTSVYEFHCFASGTDPEMEPPVCDFEISPYPAEVYTEITLSDLSTNSPTGYAWFVKPPIGAWDNSSLPLTQNTTYVLTQGGQYTFAHEVGNGGGTTSCWYPFWSGINTTQFNVTPTITGNFTTNITTVNLTKQFDKLNLTLIDKDFFRNAIMNQSILGNSSAGFIDWMDEMTETVNTTIQETNRVLNPFVYLYDLGMTGHNLFVVNFLPLLAFVSFPLMVTAAVVGILPVEIQALVSMGLIVDFMLILLYGGD